MFSLNETRSLFLGIITVAVVLSGTGAHAIVLIDSTTQGYYNAGLGDLHGIAQPAENFPAANCGGGCNAMTDPIIPNAPEPYDLGPSIGTWLTASPPMGGAWSTMPVNVPDSWAVNTETAIVYGFDAGADGLSNFHIDAGVDNGIFMWLDGSFLFGSLAPGGSDINEYDFDIAAIAPGQHYLQVLREDHGGETGYDMLVTADQNFMHVGREGGGSDGSGRGWGFAGAVDCAACHMTPPVIPEPPPIPEPPAIPVPWPLSLLCAGLALLDTRQRRRR